jgi:hypothetical protein
MAVRMMIVMAIQRKYLRETEKEGFFILMVTGLYEYRNRRKKLFIMTGVFAG